MFEGEDFKGVCWQVYVLLEVLGNSFVFLGTGVLYAFRYVLLGSH